jgi:hypothetical protein
MRLYRPEAESAAKDFEIVNINDAPNWQGPVRRAKGKTFQCLRPLLTPLPIAISILTSNLRIRKRTLKAIGMQVWH